MSAQPSILGAICETNIRKLYMRIDRSRQNLAYEGGTIVQVAASQLTSS